MRGSTQVFLDLNQPTIKNSRKMDADLLIIIETAKQHRKPWYRKLFRK